MKYKVTHTSPYTGEVTIDYYDNKADAEFVVALNLDPNTVTVEEIQ